MRELFFVVLIAQLFFVLLFLAPLLSIGEYKQLRKNQRKDAEDCLSKASDITASKIVRLANYVKVVVLALDLWPVRATIVHCIVFILLLQLIK